MGLAELLLIAVGLSMDACAVAICKGLEMKRVNKLRALIIALFFGSFQALMPFLGWLLGGEFSSRVLSMGHWIAFGLLLVIGGKMIYDGFEPEGVEDDKILSSFTNGPLDLKELTLLAIATSIDALAVGVTFAFLNVNIVAAVGLIGCITFAISFAGVFIGSFFGERYKRKAEFAGGTILILIGIKILLDHLGVI